MASSDSNGKPSQSKGKGSLPHYEGVGRRIIRFIATDLDNADVPVRVVGHCDTMASYNWTSDWTEGSTLPTILVPGIQSVENSCVSKLT